MKTTHHDNTELAATTAASPEWSREFRPTRSFLRFVLIGWSVLCTLPWVFFIVMSATPLSWTTWLFLWVVWSPVLIIAAAMMLFASTLRLILTPDSIHIRSFFHHRRMAVKDIEGYRGNISCVALVPADPDGEALLVEKKRFVGFDEVHAWAVKRFADLDARDRNDPVVRSWRRRMLSMDVAGVLHIIIMLCLLVTPRRIPLMPKHYFWLMVAAGFACWANTLLAQYWAPPSSFSRRGNPAYHVSMLIIAVLPALGVILMFFLDAGSHPLSRVAWWALAFTPVITASFVLPLVRRPRRTWWLVPIYAVGLYLPAVALVLYVNTFRENETGRSKSYVVMAKNHELVISNMFPTVAMDLHDVDGTGMWRNTALLVASRAINTGDIVRLSFTTGLLGIKNIRLIKIAPDARKQCEVAE